MEIDYLNEESNPSVDCFRKLPLDYRIGSVHMLYNDGSEVVDVDVSAAAFKRIVDEQFGGDLERVVRLYYGRLRRMLELGGFDIVGHADKMHYNAACYRPGLIDEVWYDTLVKEFLKILPHVAIRWKSIPSPIMIWELSIPMNVISRCCTVWVSGFRSTATLTIRNGSIVAVRKHCGHW